MRRRRVVVRRPLHFSECELTNQEREKRRRSRSKSATAVCVLAGIGEDVWCCEFPLSCGVAASPPLRTSGKSSHGPFRHWRIPVPSPPPPLCPFPTLRPHPLTDIRHVGYFRNLNNFRRRPVVAHIRTRRRQCHQQLNSRCLHRGAHTTTARRCWLETHIQEGGIYAEVDGFKRSGAYLCCM
jgi:hypothetical protein